MTNLNKVSLVKCTNYSKEDVRSAVDKTFSLFGGIENIIKKGSKVLLKPNFLKESSPRKCIITHPVVIETVAEMVLEAGAMPVIGDSPAFGSVAKVARRIGLDKVAEKLGIDIIELDKPRKVSINCGGKEFSLTVSGRALDVDAIINLPKLRCMSRYSLPQELKTCTDVSAASKRHGDISRQKMIWNGMPIC